MISYHGFYFFGLTVKYGPMVFYLFGPLDSAVRPSSLKTNEGSHLAVPSIVHRRKIQNRERNRNFYQLCQVILDS